MTLCSYYCDYGMTAEARFQAYDVLGSGVPTFNVLVFQRALEWQNYLGSCIGDEENGTSFNALYFPSQSCTGPLHVWSERSLTIVFECLAEDGLCIINFGGSLICSFRESGAFGLGIAGIILAGIIFLLIVAFSIVSFRKKFISTETLVPLGGIFLIAVLSVVFWSLFIVQSKTERTGGDRWSLFSTKLSVSMFWLEKVDLVVSSLLYLYWFFNGWQLFMKMCVLQGLFFLQ